MFLGFSKHATAVQRIVDDLAHCGSLWVDVHSVARFQMSDDTLGSYLERQARRFSKAAHLAAGVYQKSRLPSLLRNKIFVSNI